MWEHHNQRSRDARSLFRTFALVGGHFWAGKKKYLGSADLITHIGPLSTPLRGCGGMDCSGWVWITISRLGSCSHLGMSDLLGAQACCWARFSMAKKSISS